MTLVLGVDGCKGGWCCVPNEVGEDGLQVGQPAVFDSFEQALATNAAVICIDIPVGLLDRPGQRACDVEARRLLSSGWPRVFPPPSRAVLVDAALADFFLGAPAALGDIRLLHRRACDVNRETTGLMLNLQSFYIAPKVYQVDSLITRELQARVREVHPEVCFWALNGCSPVTPSKKTVEGKEKRWELLRGVFFDELPSDPVPPSALKGKGALDDYIDALVAAWTGVCILRRQARRIPAKREIDSRGLRMEMWYPAPKHLPGRGRAARRR